MLRAGARTDFLELKQSAGAPVFAALKEAMLSRDLQLNVCYCSIFDECWKSDLTKLSLKPQPVKECSRPKVQFDQGVLNRAPEK
ncbi:MAG TPA: hypothetical protein VGM84_14170 [Steroidobacteraceae bacterium]